MRALGGRGGLLHVDDRAGREKLGRRADHDHGRVVGPRRGHDGGQAFRDTEGQRPDRELPRAWIAPAGRVVGAGDPAHRRAGAEQAESDRTQVEDPPGHQRVGHRELEPEPPDEQRQEDRGPDLARQVEQPAEAPGGRRRFGRFRRRLVGGDPAGEPGQDRDHAEERGRVDEEHGGLAGGGDDDAGDARTGDPGQPGDGGEQGGAAAQFARANQVHQERLPRRGVNYLDAAGRERHRHQVPDAHPAGQQWDPDGQRRAGQQGLGDPGDPGRPVFGHDGPGPPGEQQHRQAGGRVHRGQGGGAAVPKVQDEPEQGGVVHHRAGQGDHLRGQVPAVALAAHPGYSGHGTNLNGRPVFAGNCRGQEARRRAETARAVRGRAARRTVGNHSGLAGADSAATGGNNPGVQAGSGRAAQGSFGIKGFSLISDRR